MEAGPWLRRAPVICGATSAALAGVVLLGWVAGWEAVLRPDPELSAMKVNTALGLGLLGIGLVARGRSPVPAVVLGSAVMVVALISLGGYAGLPDSLDTFLLGDAQRSLEPDLAYPGRMAPATAVMLLLLGMGLVLSRSRQRLSVAAALGSLLLAGLSLLGYAYGVVQLHQVGDYTSVAVHTALIGSVLAVGLLCATPDIGYVALLRDPGSIGRIVRRLSLFAVLVAPWLGFLRLTAQRRGVFDTNFGTALMVIAITVGVLGATWFAARAALPHIRAREAALADAVAAQQRLQLVLEASEVFSARLEVGEVLQAIGVHVAELMGDASSIRLLNDKRETLHPQVTHHPEPAVRDALIRDFDRVTQADAGISAGVLKSGVAELVPAITPEVLARIRDPELRSALEASGIRSIIVAPLVHGGEVRGVLAAIRQHSEVPYDQHDVDLVADLARRGAQAIESAELVEAKVRAESALAELGRHALVAEDPAELAERAVELLARALSAEHAFYFTGTESSLAVAAVVSAAGQASTLEVGTEVRGGAPLMAMATGEPVVCDDMRHDPDPVMVDLSHVLDVDSGVAVPVTGRSVRHGVLTASSAGVGRFSDADLHIVEAFGGILASALDNLAAREQLQTLVRDRERLLVRLVAAQDEERNKIADGVHDDQVQAMAALDLRLGALRNRVAEATPDLLPELDRAHETMAGAVVRLRDLLFDLQAPTPGVDLVVAVEETARHIFEGVERTHWEVDSAERLVVAVGMRTAAHRIIKEALINVREHARASRVSVQIRSVDEGLEVVVTDDGIGIAPEITQSPPGHRGLSSMHDRAAGLGGWLRVVGRPEEGTTVHLWLPERTPDQLPG